MSLITLAHPIGCDAEEIARRVADGLSVEVYDDARLREEALRIGFHTEQLKGFSERPPDWFERLLGDKPEMYLNLMESVVYEAARRGTGCSFQDLGGNPTAWFTRENPAELERRMLLRVLAELGDEGVPFRGKLDALEARSPQADDPRRLELYAQACELRRARRLKSLATRAPKIVFTKHPTIRPSFFAYTEGQSDAQNERHFVPGSELCLLEMEGPYGKVRTLVADPTGAIRDPAVSWDGKRVVFAWKKSLDNDDYNLYELDTTTNQVRQITLGAGFADYEPAFLPKGDLIFASTRCVQTVDCWWTEVSNLYTATRTDVT